MAKKKKIESNPKVFAKLNQSVKQFESKGRTESAAFLIWFLQTIYRLDETEAQDAVCDKTADMGIDALTVDDDSEEVVVFQAKRKTKLPSTLGDSDLKSFVGALTQFRNKKAVENLASSTGNSELKALLSTHKVGDKIERGYTVRPIFLANVTADASANAYIKTTAEAGTAIDLWDLSRIAPVLAQLSKDWFVDEEVKLRIDPEKVFIGGAKTNPDLLVAAISARQLVRLPGIDDTRLFAQNVRLGLGGTRVNKEILESVKTKAEHPRFVTFHNGLTMVAQEIGIRGKTLTLNKYSVCNGCQSLLTFYDNRSLLTDELEVLVRLVRVGERRETAESIAYKTNNQNAISLRDLSANDATQIQLKAEFDGLFGDRVEYVIKRGETSGKAELHNEQAGQLLLALYARQPWSAHQKYKIFGDLKSQIFRYGIGAPQIRLAQLIAEQTESLLPRLKNERVRRYGLTKFIIIYLVGELLRTEADGVKLLDDPRSYLHVQGVNKSKAIETKLLKGLEELTALAVTELSYFVEDKGGDAYPYKDEFKAESEVRSIRTEVMKAYDKDKYKKRVTAFELPK